MQCGNQEGIPGTPVSLNWTEVDAASDLLVRDSVVRRLAGLTLVGMVDLVAALARTTQSTLTLLSIESSSSPSEEPERAHRERFSLLSFPCSFPDRTADIRENTTWDLGELSGSDSPPRLTPAW